MNMHVILVNKGLQKMTWKHTRVSIEISDENNISYVTPFGFVYLTLQYIPEFYPSIWGPVAIT